MDIIVYFLVSVLGILISIFLPGLRKLAVEYRQRAGPAGMEGVSLTLLKAVKPYLGIGIFAALTGLVLLALLGDSITDWKIALLFGYAWESTLDSTIQKLAK